jgi:hypothetical protein
MITAGGVGRVVDSIRGAPTPNRARMKKIVPGDRPLFLLEPSGMTEIALITGTQYSGYVSKRYTTINCEEIPIVFFSLANYS